MGNLFSSDNGALADATIGTKGSNSKNFGAKEVVENPGNFYQPSNTGLNIDVEGGEAAPANPLNATLALCLVAMVLIAVPLGMSAVCGFFCCPDALCDWICESWLCDRRKRGKARKSGDVEDQVHRQILDEIEERDRLISSRNNISLALSAQPKRVRRDVPLSTLSPSAPNNECPDYEAATTSQTMASVHSIDRHSMSPVTISCDHIREIHVNVTHANAVHAVGFKPQPMVPCAVDKGSE